jgi:hypothetical protein
VPVAAAATALSAAPTLLNAAGRLGGRVALGAATAPERVRARADAVTQQGAAAARALLDLRPQRTRRRVWLLLYAGWGTCCCMRAASIVHGNDCVNDQVTR